MRGESNLFYLDFKHLGDIIRNNWEIFEQKFPDQNWIIAKINELAKIRNLVAHNSLVGDDEIDILRTNTRSIMKQISETT